MACTGRHCAEHSPEVVSDRWVLDTHRSSGGPEPHCLGLGHHRPTAWPCPDYTAAAGRRQRR